MIPAGRLACILQSMQHDGVTGSGNLMVLLTEFRKPDYPENARGELELYQA